MPPPPPPPPPPLHAHKLHLPPPSAASAVASLLSDPSSSSSSSSSVALLLSDSSALLFPSLSPSSSPAPVSVASASAACFARILPSPSSPTAHVLFLSASPSPSASLLLRAWSLPPRAASFAPAALALNRGAPAAAARGLAIDALPFGLGVRLAGSVNAVALHSLAAAQIWILAARMATDSVVELKKCAVIELSTPIYSMAVGMGCLVLGEVGGVRVFPLRPMIKGRAVAKKGCGSAPGQGNGDSSKKKGVLNGVVIVPTGHGKGGKVLAFEAGKGTEVRGGCRCNGEVEGCVEGGLAPIKLKTMRIKQNSENSCSFFAAITCASVQNQKNGMGALASAKAVSVHALSKNKFLILDSAGDLHVLSLHNNVVTSDITDQCSLTSKEAHTYRLDHPMKVQLLAVLPNTSTKTQVVWVSDGGHTVHMMSLSDIEYSVGGNGQEERKSTMIQISAIEAIFASEKLRDIVPISPNAVLVLGQGNIFVYGTA